MSRRHDDKMSRRRDDKRKNFVNSVTPNLLAEARKLKQQAERRPEGPDREPLLKQSSELFEMALQQSLSPQDKEECLFDLAEVFLQWSISAKIASFRITGSPLTGNTTKNKALELKNKSLATAASLSRKSLEVYDRIQLEHSHECLNQEATVNSGTALCEWAELALEIAVDYGGGIEVAKDLYSQADSRYSAALAVAPDDVELLTNIGDCSIRRAELMFSDENTKYRCDEDVWTNAEPLYEHGLRAYFDACSKVDTRSGDDLTGLLQNWGAGLFLMGRHVPDLGRAISLFTVAREKLENAIKLSPTDTSHYNLLGEIYIAEAERRLTVQIEEFMKILEGARNSFGTALKIDSSNIDAILGLAEAHQVAAKFLLSNGFSLAGKEQGNKSVDLYLKACKFLCDERNHNLDFEEQCDVLYNLACIAAISDRQTDARAAVKRLEKVDCLDVLNDADLENLRILD